ncbi:MAG TPA: hypothetical protein VH679_14880 [Vicinamibacterales bacterium]|jgi:hypothetical protein
MTRRTKLLIGGLGVVALAVAYFALRPSGDRVAIDLIEQLPMAKDRRPSADVFSVVDATLAGKREQAILTKQPSRIKYNVTVPDEAWLKFSLGLLEESWTIPGDGVLFQIGVSSGPEYVELLSLVVNPYGNPTDRGWQPLVLDLSQFAGENVDLIFNTYASPPPNPDRDHNGDAALWGAPRIVIR